MRHSHSLWRRRRVGRGRSSAGQTPPTAAAGTAPPSRQRWRNCACARHATATGARRAATEALGDRRTMPDGGARRPNEDRRRRGGAPGSAAVGARGLEADGRWPRARPSPTTRRHRGRALRPHRRQRPARLQDGARGPRVARVLAVRASPSACRRGHMLAGAAPRAAAMWRGARAGPANIADLGGRVRRAREVL